MSDSIRKMIADAEYEADFIGPSLETKDVTRIVEEAVRRAVYEAGDIDDDDEADLRFVRKCIARVMEGEHEETK